MQKTRHPVTSRAAYKSQLQKGNITTMKQKIMRVMKRIKWGNQDKIASVLGVHPSQVWRRLPELVKDGELERTNIALRSQSTGELQSVYKLPKYKLKLTA